MPAGGRAREDILRRLPTPARRYLRQARQALGFAAGTPLPVMEAADAAADGVRLGIDEVVFYRGRLHIVGHVFDLRRPITGLSYRWDDDQPWLCIKGYPRSRPDLIEQYGAAAAQSGFGFALDGVEQVQACSVQLGVELGDSVRMVIRDLHTHRPPTRTSGLMEQFRLAGTKFGGKVLEIGSRARSGNTYLHIVPDGYEHVGFDVVDGPNVDVVGDVHSLSQHFEPDSVDAVFSIATFEHLAMPWKVALELNRVMKTGALLLTVTHQAWPVHEAPWDFWRFSQYSWPTLFNAATGFEVVDSAMDDLAGILPKVARPETVHLPDAANGYMTSSSLVRKVGPARVRWDVGMEEILQTAYPE